MTLFGAESLSKGTCSLTSFLSNAEPVLKGATLTFRNGDGEHLTMPLAFGHKPEAAGRCPHGPYFCPHPTEGRRAGTLWLRPARLAPEPHSGPISSVK